MRRFPVAVALTIALACLCLTRTAHALGQETFGNKPLNAVNYREWAGLMPLVNDGTRVYHSWVNGNEHVLYKGDTARLNEALRNFAKIEAKDHEVVLRPGPGIGQTFHGQQVPHNWQLQFNGGLAKHLTTLDQGSKVWNADPALTIYIGGDIDLAKIEIPQGVTVIDAPTLSKRVAAGMSESKDKTVRGWGNGELARLDPYSDENMKTIERMLNDPDNWVRLNATGALSRFGRKATPHLPALRALLGSDDASLRDGAQRAIKAIEQAPDQSEEEQRHAQTQMRIAVFIAARTR